MSRLWMLVLAGVFSSGVAAADNVRSMDPDNLIHGLGERRPDAENLSRSPDFNVYRFDKDGIEYVQINAPDGEVLTAIGLTGSGAFVLPIGSLSRESVRISTAGPAVGGGMQQPSAECPCSSVVVYSDAYATVVVVYGAGGEVIEVVVIHHTVSPPIPN